VVFVYRWTGCGQAVARPNATQVYSYSKVADAGKGMKFITECRGGEAAGRADEKIYWLPRTPAKTQTEQQLIDVQIDTVRAGIQLSAVSAW